MGSGYSTQTEDKTTTTLGATDATPNLAEVEGFCTPTTAGNYILLGDNGGFITIPSNYFILHTIYSTPDTDQLAGGTSVHAVLSTAPNVAGTAVTAAVPTANVVLGTNAAVTYVDAVIGGATPVNFVNVTTIGTYTGTLKVRMIILKGK